MRTKYNINPYPENITIKVTQEDILKGVPNSRTCCPIALAMRKVLPLANVRVHVAYVTLNDKTYFLPNIATNFILRFDSKQEVEQFSFEFQL